MARGHRRHGSPAGPGPPFRLTGERALARLPTARQSTEAMAAPLPGIVLARRIVSPVATDIHQSHALTAVETLLQIECDSIELATSTAWPPPRSPTAAGSLRPRQGPHDLRPEEDARPPDGPDPVDGWAPPTDIGRASPTAAASATPIRARSGPTDRDPRRPKSPPATVRPQVIG